MTLSRFILNLRQAGTRSGEDDNTTLWQEGSTIRFARASRLIGNIGEMVHCPGDDREEECWEVGVGADDERRDDCEAR